MNSTHPAPIAASLAAFIGIDWAADAHAVCWRCADETTLHERTVEHTPEALAAWVSELAQQFGTRPVGICLEQSRGPLVYALSAYPWIVLYPINPKSLARYREALYPSGAKDDPPDAHLLMQFLAEHREQLRPWTSEDTATRQLRGYLEQRDKLVDQRTALVNQLGAQLKQYFPQALAWAGTLTTRVAWDFLLRWPTLPAVQKATKAQLLAFFYGHHVRRGDKLSDLHEQIRGASALHNDEGIIEPSVALVQALCKMLGVLQTSIDHHEKQIARLYGAHADAAIFESLPGAGPVLEPRLLVALGTDRTRWDSALSVAQLSGIAPVTVRSGKREWVHFRWAAASFLRQSFHEFAASSRRWSVWADEYYGYQRELGKEHHAAVRALAFRWIRIIYRCWKNKEAYQESKYMAALRRSGSGLIARIDRRLKASQPATAR